MALYFKDIEITKIRDLAPQTGLDITDIWFGSTNVYTVWQVYEGTLPATFNANGDNMRQYQIWGNTGGVGDRTKNLFNGYFEQGTTADGVPTASNNRVRSNIVAAVAGTFSINFKNEENFDVAFDFWNGGVLVENTLWLSTKNYTTPNNATSVRIKIRKSNNDPVTPDEVIDFGMYSGSTAPASYVPFGYEVDMVSRTRNLCPNTTILSSAYTVTTNTGNLFNVLKNIKPGVEHTLSWSYKSNGSGGVSNQIRLYTSETALVKLIDNGSVFSLTAGEITTFSKITAYFGANNTNGGMSKFMLSEGTAALPYEPYSNTTTPIYIGDEPLDKDEYIDYQAGKIYRMINGVLTPTDPPVPLPALPTCDGTTVIDYAGQSVAPEKALLKYRKEGF